MYECEKWGWCTDGPTPWLNAYRDRRLHVDTQDSEKDCAFSLLPPDEKQHDSGKGLIGAFPRVVVIRGVLIGLTNAGG